MHAVLLAAGIGQRLSEITGGGPKCLLPFGGASLLERHLRQLAGTGIRRLTIVIGCEAMQIEQALGAIAPRVAPDMTIITEFNPDFRAGSAISALAAREAMCSGEDILLMDADVLYDRRMLVRLLESRQTNCFLLDRAVDIDDPEPVKLCLKDGAFVAFDKQLPVGLAFDVIGESVGFFRLAPAMSQALVVACERARDADPAAPHEHALRDLLLERRREFGYEDVTGLPWIEIDYPQDVDRAEAEILPQLQDEV